MTIRSTLLAAAIAVGSALSATAATYDLGDVTNGAVFDATLRVQSVDFIEFSLDAPAGFRLSALTISVTSRERSNFSEAIALYSNGSLVRAASAVRGGGNTATLTFGGPTALAEGAYVIGVAGWRAFFTPDIANARSTAFFNDGRYTLRIDPTISAVPLPAGGLLLLAGLGAFAIVRRKARRT